jgi:hypothetical protein
VQIVEKCAQQFWLVVTENEGQTGHEGSVTRAGAFGDHQI